MRRLGLVWGGGWLACAMVAQPAEPSLTALGGRGQTLEAPARLAVDPTGNLYVTEPGAGQVVVFDPFGREIGRQRGLARPLGIAVDAPGRIYVAEEKAGRVRIFDGRWQALGWLGQGSGEFRLPNHIATATTAEGTTVYVSDSLAHQIKAYLDGMQVMAWGGLGAGEGQFDFPTGICVAPGGEVVVVDQNHDRIQVFDREGLFRRAFALGSTSPSGRSQAVTVDSSGRVFVADSFQGVVRVYDLASGTLLAQAGRFGQRDGELNSPAGLALDSLNRLWVTSLLPPRLEGFGLDAFVHLAALPPASKMRVGEPLVMTAVAGGPGPVSFQWNRNGVALAGATNGQFTVLQAASTDSGAYSVVVSGPPGSFTSGPATVEILAPPAILDTPADVLALRGSDHALDVVCQGSALSYQWHFNGLPLAGATNRVLVLTGLQSTQSGFYALKAWNDVGVAVGPAILLTVVTPPVVMEIVSSALDADRWFHLTLNVDLGFSYALDTSTDLVHWTGRATFAESIGLVEFVDGEPVEGNRFYRLRWIPPEGLEVAGPGWEGIPMAIAGSAAEMASRPGRSRLGEVPRDPGFR